MASHVDRTDVDRTDRIDVDVTAGTISGLGVNVRSLYKLSTTCKDIVKKTKGSVMLLDIQYLGSYPINKLLESIKSPRNNSMFISTDSNVSSLICNTEPKKSIKRSNKSNNDAVTNYMKGYQNDQLKCYYTDYDTILDSVVSHEIVAGDVTKMRRLPVISMYSNNTSMDFIECVATDNGTPLPEKNTSNFIVYSGSIQKDNPKTYIIGDGKSLKYHHSYIIEYQNSKLMLSKVNGEDTLSNYVRDYSSSDMVIDGCKLVNLLKEAFDKSS